MNEMNECTRARKVTVGRGVYEGVGVRCMCCPGEWVALLGNKAGMLEAYIYLHPRAWRFISALEQRRSAARRRRLPVRCVCGTQASKRLSCPSFLQRRVRDARVCVCVKVNPPPPRGTGRKRGAKKMRGGFRWCGMGRGSCPSLRAWGKWKMPLAPVGARRSETTPALLCRCRVRFRFSVRIVAKVRHQRNYNVEVQVLEFPAKGTVLTDGVDRGEGGWRGRNPQDERFLGRGRRQTRSVKHGR